VPRGPTNIVLDWAQWTEAHGYDQRLSPIAVRSRDGFAFCLDVSQIIHIGMKNAPQVAVASRAAARCWRRSSALLARLLGAVAALRAGLRLAPGGKSRIVDERPRASPARPLR
jgi:hypothetical protein